MSGCIADDLACGQPAILFREVGRRVKWIPKLRKDRDLNRSTPFRWWRNGLEAVRVGSALATTEGSLIRYFAKRAHTGTSPVAKTLHQREKVTAAAIRELEADGI